MLDRHAGDVGVTEGLGDDQGSNRNSSDQIGPQQFAVVSRCPIQDRQNVGYSAGLLTDLSVGHVGDLLSMVALGGRAFLLLRWMMSMEREALNQAGDPGPRPGSDDRFASRNQAS